MRNHRPFLAACVIAAAALLSVRAVAAQETTTTTTTTTTTVTTTPVDSAAAAPAAAPAPAARPPRLRRDVITLEQARASNSRNLYEAIEHLHPTWFRIRSTGSMGEAGRQIAVFLDGQLVGGPDVLKSMTVEQIATVQYLDAIHASAEYGDRGKMGAIVVNSH